MNVTIFGAGNMGSAIAGVLGAGGAGVDHITSADTDATVRGDLVVLAVPYPALSQITERYGDQLAGKIVVDITNPLNFETFDSLVVPPDGSAAAELAAALPSSRVLKAFNTTSRPPWAPRPSDPSRPPSWWPEMTRTQSRRSSAPSSPGDWRPRTWGPSLVPASSRRWGSSS